MIKKDNFGTRSNSKLAASGPIKAGTTNANLGGKSVVARSNTPAQDPNLGRLVLTTISQDIPKYSINGEGNQVAINYTSLQIPKEKELRHPLIAGIQVSLVSGNFSQLITITSTLALNDTTISVASFNPNVDIGKGALICIDEEDLFNQYQNKTKGTIAGFTVDSDGIAKSGIEVTDWLNSDTMTGASVNNVPTALSVKNYVDNSHPAEDQTLQEVTDNGNTTTNDIILSNNNVLRSSHSDRFIQIQNGSSQMIFSSYGAHIHKTYDNVSYAERMRLSRFGDLSIGTTTGGYKLLVSGTGWGGEGIAINSTTTAGAVLTLKTTQREYQIASRNDSFEIRDITAGDITRIDINSTGRTTFGNTTNAGPLKVYYSDGSYVNYTGYGIELNRDYSYLRPTSTNNKRLFIGNQTLSWFELELNSTTTLFKNGTEEFMRITSAGLVGIGTSSPTHKLDISGGKIQINDGGATWFGSDGTGGFVRTFNGNTFRFLDSSGGETMRIDNANDRVGIGTSSPSELLELKAANPKLRFVNSDNNQRAQMGHSAGYGGFFSLTNDSNVANVILRSYGISYFNGGNFGIGTSSPNRLLTLANTTGGGAYQALNSTSNNNTTIGSDAVGAFIVYDDTASSYRMVVKASTGNVLIGTTTDGGHKLQVNGNAVVSGKLMLGSSASGEYITRTGSPYRMGFFTSGSEKMSIANGGNVLIGTTTDSSARLKSLSANGNDFSLMLGRADTNNLWRFNHAGNDLRIYNQATSGSNIILGADAGGIAEANNVLIGTGTDSGEKLQVAGTASFVNSGNGQIDITRTSGANTFIQSQSSTGVIGTSTNHRLDLKTNSTTRATITTGGRLGLGVTSPSVPLHIANDAPTIRLQDLTSSDNHYLTGNNGEFRIQSTGLITMRPNNAVSVTFNENGTTTFGGQVTIPATPVATTDAASKSYVDSQVAEAGTSSFGSFTPASTQTISSGGNVGVKSTLLLATSQVTASNITTSSAGLTFANAGLYQISFNFASKVSGTANRTLAAANLEYSTDGETWTEIVGSLVYNYDRGTATGGGSSTYGFVYDGSSSASFIHNLATSSKIRARFWIEGRASSASGITTIINGCRLSAHKIG